MQIFWYIFFIVLGLLIASFLNVCIDRLPRGKSIVRPPSHCDSCQKRVPIKDLIPIYSYLRLRGRCRYCQSPIPRRVLWVEIGTGAYFGFLFWHFGLSPELGIVAFYSCIFITLFVIDLEHGLIMNKIVYPTMVLALIINLVLSLLRSDWYILINSLIGGAIGFCFFFLIVVVSRGGMGWGDVKMAGLIGLIIGWPQVFVALLIAVIIGGLLAIFLLFLKIKGRKQTIPFGPFLAIGAILTLLFGSNIWSWYFNIISLG